MTKRIKYKIGDILLLPIAGDVSSVAQILNTVKGVSLIRLFATVFNNERDYFDIEQDNILNSSTDIFLGIDEGIKSGEWKIIDNISVELPIEMPFVWEYPGFSADPELYHLIKCSYYDPLHGEGKITKADSSVIQKYHGIGIDFPEAAINDCIKFLKKEKVL